MKNYKTLFALLFVFTLSPIKIFAGFETETQEFFDALRKKYPIDDTKLGNLDERIYAVKITKDQDVENPEKPSGALTPENTIIYNDFESSVWPALKKLKELAKYSGSRKAPDRILHIETSALCHIFSAAIQMLDGKMGMSRDQVHARKLIKWYFKYIPGILERFEKDYTSILKKIKTTSNYSGEDFFNDLQRQKVEEEKWKKETFPIRVSAPYTG